MDVGLNVLICLVIEYCRTQSCGTLSQYLRKDSLRVDMTIGFKVPRSLPIGLILYFTHCLSRSYMIEIEAIRFVLLYAMESPPHGVSMSMTYVPAISSHTAGADIMDTEKSAQRGSWVPVV